MRIISALNRPPLRAALAAVLLVAGAAASSVTGPHDDEQGMPVAVETEAPRDVDEQPDPAGDGPDEPGEDAPLPEESAPAPEDTTPAPDGPTKPSEESTDPSEEPTEPAEEPTGPDEDEQVLVVLPEVERTLVDGVPGYVLPRGTGGFSWLVDGVHVDDLVAAGTAVLVPSPAGDGYAITDVGTTVLGAVAEPGRALVGEDGAPSAVRYVVDPRLPVELAEPTASDGAGRDDAIVVPDVAGQLVRDGDGTELAPGTRPVSAEYVDGVATVVLAVAAADGYRLEVGGAPVEALPGAGGPWSVVLSLTDVVAEPTPEDSEQIADAPEPTPVPSAPAAPAPVEEDAQPREETEVDAELPLTVDLVTIASAEPAPVEAEAAPAAAEETERLPRSGPEGLGLIAMLGGLLLGGSWLVLSMRGE